MNHSSFHSTEMKITNVSFQPSWFVKQPFFHYDEDVQGSSVLPHLHESIQRKEDKVHI